MVDNPTSWESSFCLPLIVVNFGTPKPSPLRKYAELISTDATLQDHYEPGAYKSMPFRWHWMQDNGYVLLQFLLYRYFSKSIFPLRVCVAHP